MKIKHCLFLLLCTLFAFSAFAQNQQAMLKDKDPQLAKNKKLVYDFWREVFEGGHLELAPKYMTEGYIQHNPNVPTGRQAFMEFFAQYASAKPVTDTIKASLVAITADGDLVTLVFKQEKPEPKMPGKKYITTWFDMFRIENGKIAEHWDPALKM